MAASLDSADKVEVMKVSTVLGGPVLVLRRTEKSTLWDYFEDWHGEAIIEFVAMPKAELDALGEFEGF